MLVLEAVPPESNTVLFEALLEPPEPTSHKGVADEPALRTARGRKNRVQVGTPQTTDVLEAWPRDQRLAAEIEAGRTSADYWCVRLACSFLPDRGCRFVWARLAVELTARESGDTAVTSAVVIDLFPRLVVDTRTYRRSFAITPTLQLAFAEVSLPVKTEGEVLRYQSQLVGAGLLTEQPTWTFTAGQGTGLTGSHELFLLVKKPKHAPLSARFSIGAEIQTALGRIPLRRYEEPELVRRSYMLSPL